MSSSSLLPFSLGKDLTRMMGWPSIVVGLLTLYYFYFRWKTSYWSRNGIKGYFAIPFLGNGWSLFWKPWFQVEMELVQTYGKLVGAYNGTKPALIVADPEVIKAICVKDFHIFPQSFNQPYLHRAERKFLTLLYGKEWKRIRSLISPTFTSGKLKRMYDLLGLCTKECMANLAEEVKSSDTLDLKRFWGRYNMDVISKCCFATNLNAYSDEENEALHNFEKLFTANLGRALVNILIPPWLAQRAGMSLNNANNLEYIRDLALHVIESRKKENNNKYKDFLQLMLENEMIDKNASSIDESKLTTEEIVGSAIIFLLAGYETTSTLLSWTCWELMKNPEVQEKLYQEVSQADELTYEKVNSLPYLEAVIQESLRLHPPVIQFQRVCHEDYQIPGTQAIMPKGTNISIPVYAIHHDSEYYPEPEVFNPDRFLPENKDSIQPYTFLPFGSGPKNCIGMRFALVNAKLALATLIRKYKLVRNANSTENVEYARFALILAAKKINVGIQPR